MYLNNFRVEEFVPKSVYNKRGAKSIYLMDKELLVFIDEFRDHIGAPITINNWKWGGNFQFRGLRTPDSDVYSQFSQHSFGRALDFDVKGYDAAEIRKWIIDNRDLWWVKPITFIEDGVSWVHVDTRCTPDNQLWSWHVKTGNTEIYRR